MGKIEGFMFYKIEGLKRWKSSDSFSLFQKKVGKVQTLSKDETLSSASSVWLERSPNSRHQKHSGIVSERSWVRAPG